MTSAREAAERAPDVVNEVDRLTNAICTVNRPALVQADELDHEYSAGRIRSPLRGRCIVVKHSIDTADLLTTAGSLALADREGSLASGEGSLMSGEGSRASGEGSRASGAPVRWPVSPPSLRAVSGLSRGNVRPLEGRFLASRGAVSGLPRGKVRTSGLLVW
jgi:hypothetical protein